MPLPETIAPVAAYDVFVLVLVTVKPATPVGSAGTLKVKGFAHTAAFPNSTTIGSTAFNPCDGLVYVTLLSCGKLIVVVAIASPHALVIVSVAVPEL